jgi:hypothetical protein
VAFRYIAAGSHPDHDTIASFRKRFLGEIDAFFVQILHIAHQMGFRKAGIISLDATKVKANASRHKALSYKHAEKLQKQLESEVRYLLRLAEETDATELPPEMDILGELKRRQDRLKVIAEAKAEIERRARERYERDMEAYDERMAERKRVEDQRGKKIRGRAHKAPEPKVRDGDQVNLTDGQSRIMPVSGGGFEQAYNCQAALENESGLILTQQVSQSPVDRNELETPPQDAREAKDLWPAQGDHRTRLRGYKAGEGLPSVPAPWPSGCQRRMEPGLLPPST